MAGTKQYVEALVGLVANTIFTIASNEKQSLEGIDILGMQDGSTCYVRATGGTYRFFDTSAAPASPTVVVPAVLPPSGLGRWILITATNVVGLLATYHAENPATIPAMGSFPIGVDVVLCTTPPVVLAAGQSVLSFARTAIENTGGAAGSWNLAILAQPGAIFIDAVEDAIIAGNDLTTTLAATKKSVPADLAPGAYTFELHASIPFAGPTVKVPGPPPAAFSAGAQLLIEVVNV